MRTQRRLHIVVPEPGQEGSVAAGRSSVADRPLHDSTHQILLVHCKLSCLLVAKVEGSSPTAALSLVHHHTHMSLLSMLSTRRTGSLTFMSSVTFIPYTILSTASPRCCCARFSADTGCGRRAAAAVRVDATAAPGATPLLRSKAPVVRVNRACIVFAPRGRER